MSQEKDLVALKRKFFETLDERQKRLFAGLEALYQGHYGVTAVSKTLNIHPITVRKGKAELENSVPAYSPNRVRKAGGGRKKNKGKAN